MTLPAISIVLPIQRKPFKDIGHSYWIGRERLYSLSRVLRDLGLKPDFSGIDPTVLWRAQTRGKLTEWYASQLLQGKRVTVRSKHCGSLTNDVALRVQGFYNWMQKAQPTVLHPNERHRIVWSEEDHVAWQIDFGVMFDDRLRTLVELKCTSQAAKDWPLQVGMGLTYGAFSRGGVLHLNPRFKDGYRWIPYKPLEVKRQWRIAIDTWKARYAFNQLKAELGFTTESYGFEVEDDLAEAIS